MTKTSLAHDAHPSIPEPQPEYVLRGLGLFELHGDDILAGYGGDDTLYGYQGAGRWLIPSGTVGDRLYEVRVGTRPEGSRCECVGYQHHGHCSHIVCAIIARKKSALCEGCGHRYWHRDLVEVAEDNHDGLTWFRGDRICRGCARDSGVDW